MMKPLLTALFFIIYLTCYCQQNGNPVKDKKLIDQVKNLNIKYDSSNVKKDFLKFRSVVVNDMRFDTTNIGVWSGFHVVPVGGLIYSRRINFENGLSQMIKTCLEKSLTGSLSDTVLYCFINQFYLYRKDSVEINNSPNENFARLKINIEWYYGVNDKLYPALKLDTGFTEVLIVNKSNLSESVNEKMISDFYDLFYRKINKTDTRKVFQRLPTNYSLL